MKLCKNCMHWLDNEDDCVVNTKPIDPDTYEPMVMPFEVRYCRHPKMTFCELPVEIDGFGVADGSEYRACLITSENFGCVRYEPKNER